MATSKGVEIAHALLNHSDIHAVIEQVEALIDNALRFMDVPNMREQKSKALLVTEVKTSGAAGSITNPAGVSQLRL